MTVFQTPIRTQIYEVEAAIPNATGAGAPVSVDLVLGAPVITGLYFYCDISAALTTAYWRILHQGEVIFPGNTGQAVNAAVPGGWLACPRQMFYPIQVILPQGPSYRIQAQFINLSGATLNVLVGCAAAFITTDQLLLEIINRLDGLQNVVKG